MERLAARLIPACILAGWTCDPSRPIRHHPDASIPDCPTQPLFSADSLIGEDSCLPVPCTAVASQSDCKITISLGGCTVDMLSGTIDAAGDLALSEAPELGACRTALDTTAGARLSLSCRSAQRDCRLDLYDRPLPLTAVTSTLAIHPGSPFAAPSGSTAEPLDENDPFRGYLAGMVLLKDELVVASFGGDYALGCDANQRGALFFVDPDALSVTATAATRTCLSAIAPDPMATGFIAVSPSPLLSIGRYDRRGRLLLEEPLPALDGARQRVRMLAADGRGRIALLLDGGSVPSAYLVLLDAMTLTATAASTSVQGKVRAGAFVEGGAIAATFGEGTISGFDGTRATALSGFNLISPRRVSSAAGQLAFDTASNPARIIISATGRNAAMWVANASFLGDPALETALYFEAEAAPWSIIQDPRRGPSSSTVLVGLTTVAPDFEARIARFDPDAPRFRPGSLRIGRGAVSQMVTDGKGRVFAMLPWSATIARITFP